MYPHLSAWLSLFLIYFSKKIIFTESHIKDIKKQSVSAILACGGNGIRFVESGGKGLKQFNTVNKIPIYFFSLYEFIKHPQINHIVIATHPNLFNNIVNTLFKCLSNKNKKIALDNNYLYIYKNKIILKSDQNWEYFENYYKNQWLPPFDLVKITFCESGKSRKFTIFNALKHINDDSSIVLIHDSARPLICAVDLNRLLSVAEEKDAAVPFIKIYDTIKERLGKGIIGKRIINRDFLALIQTPQAFKSNLIKQAYNNAVRNNIEYSDCSTYFQKCLNRNVALVSGHVYNIKITTLEDYNIARYLLIDKYFKGKK